MSTLSARPFEMKRTHRPFKVLVRLLIDRASLYRDAVPFVYLGGVIGAIVYSAYRLGPSPLTGLMIGAGVMYLAMSLLYALADGSCSLAHRETIRPAEDPPHGEVETVASAEMEFGVFR